MLLDETVVSGTVSHMPCNGGQSTSHRHLGGPEIK